MCTIHRAFLLAALTFMWCGGPPVFAGTHHLIRFIRPGQLSGFGLEAMQFSPDGAILAIATTDGVVSYVSPESGEKVGTFKHSPFSIGFSKDGSRLLMIGRRSTELMDMIAGIPAKIDNSERNAKGVIGISFNLKDGKLVITTVRPGSPAEKAGTIAVGDELVGIGAGKSGEFQKVVGKSVERTLELLRGRPGEYLRLKTVPKGTIEDREVLLRRAALRATASGTEIVPFEESSIDENVVWCISDGSQAFYDAKSGRLMSSFRLSDIENNRGWHAISPDSKHCAFLARRLKPNDKEFAIEIFDVGTRERLAFHRNIESRNGDHWGAVSAFNGFHYSPDGKYLLVGNSWEVQVISAETGKELRSIETKEIWTRPGTTTTITYRISDFSLSSKGLLAVGFGNGTVRLSEFRTGEYLASLPKRDDDNKKVTGIEFSPNGKWLAYYNNDRLHMVDVEEFNPKKSDAANEQVSAKQ